MSCYVADVGLCYVAHAMLSYVILCCICYVVLLMLCAYVKLGYHYIPYVMCLMLCYVMLCYVMLCYVMLFYVASAWLSMLPLHHGVGLHSRVCTYAVQCVLLVMWIVSIIRFIIAALLQ